MPTKYYQNISTGIKVIDPYKVYSWEIIQKVSKGEQPFLHATHRLDLTYMYTKDHQNI